MEKPFLVFAGEQYYPVGGWEDFKQAFAEQKDAESFADGLIASKAFGFCHVVFLATMSIVKEWRQGRERQW